MTAVDLVEILLQRRRLIAENGALLGQSFFAFPTTPHVAMEIAPLEADQETFFSANAKTLRNTMLGNVLDWCGVQIPSGRDAGGMPTGFLLSAQHGRDTDVLSRRARRRNPRQGGFRMNAFASANHPRPTMKL